MAEGKFATKLTCMDGRIEEAATAWIKEQDPTVDFVDAITEAGMDRALSKGTLVNEAEAPVDLFKFKTLDVSVKGHGSEFITVVGHEACAGNPVEHEQHLKDIKESVDVVKKWQTGAKVAGLYLKKIDDKTWEPVVVVAAA